MHDGEQLYKAVTLCCHHDLNSERLPMSWDFGLLCFCGCTILQRLCSQISVEGNSEKKKILNKHGRVHMNRGVFGTVDIQFFWFF